MPPPFHHDAISPEPGPLLTRRTLALGFCGSAAMVLGVPGALAANTRLHADHDDDAEGDDHSGHGGDDHADDPDDDATNVPVGDVHIVDDDAMAFVPNLIIIAVGDAVTWRNMDDKTHTATGGAWDSGPIEPGASAEVTFNEAGTFAYACQYHPVMSGTVVVGGDATPVASPAASPAVTSATVDAVTIANLAFDPSTMTVAAGTTVTWTNKDQLAHTVTAIDGSFDTGTIDTGATASVTFDTPGTFPYQCGIHPGMKGTVVVT